jgi:hypothetical protein
MIENWLMSCDTDIFGYWYFCGESSPSFEVGLKLRDTIFARAIKLGVRIESRWVSGDVECIGAVEVCGTQGDG